MEQGGSAVLEMKRNDVIRVIQRVRPQFDQLASLGVTLMLTFQEIKWYEYKPRFQLWLAEFDDEHEAIIWKLTYW